jgi:hypothetical protein
MKSVLGLNPHEDGFCSSGTNQKDGTTNKIVPAGRIQKQSLCIWKLLGSSPDEEVALGDSDFFYDTQLFVSKYRDCD